MNGIHSMVQAEQDEQEYLPLVLTSEINNPKRTARRDHSNLQLAPFSISNDLSSIESEGERLSSYSTVYNDFFLSEYNNNTPSNFHRCNDNYSNVGYIATPSSDRSTVSLVPRDNSPCSNQQRDHSNDRQSHQYRNGQGQARYSNAGYIASPSIHNNSQPFLAGLYGNNSNNTDGVVGESVTTSVPYANKQLALREGESSQEVQKKIIINCSEIGSTSIYENRNCIGRRQIGEKCFALLMVSLVAGTLFTGFGATCIIPQQVGYCKVIGGLPTALILVCGGGILILVASASCIIINVCSGRALHGGKCHINCHIFEDLVE